MFGGGLRKRFSGFLDSIGAMIGKTGINPNVFSFLAIPIAGVAAYLIYIGHHMLSILAVFIAIAWDAFDGGVARSQKKTSKFGKYIEGAIDKYVEIIIYLGFALKGYAIEAFLVISGTLMLSFAKPRTAMIVKIDDHDWPAVGERVDRLTLLFISMVVSSFIPTIIVFGVGLDTLSILLYLNAMLVYIGGFQRIKYAKKIIEAGGTDNLKIRYKRSD